VYLFLSVALPVNKSHTARSFSEKKRRTKRQEIESTETPEGRKEEIYRKEKGLGCQRKLRSVFTMNFTNGGVSNLGTNNTIKGCKKRKKNRENAGGGGVGGGG